MLTLSQALIKPVNSKQVILILSGPMLGSQMRINNTQKADEANYLENENLAPLDNVYVRTSPLSSLINDRAISIP
jgi:hypothetical protein